jgi:hypothetical protein
MIISHKEVLVRFIRKLIFDYYKYSTESRTVKDSNNYKIIINLMKVAKKFFSEFDMFVAPASLRIK